MHVCLSNVGCCSQDGKGTVKFSRAPRFKEHDVAQNAAPGPGDPAGYISATMSLSPLPLCERVPAGHYSKPDEEGGRFRGPVPLPRCMAPPPL